MNQHLIRLEVFVIFVLLDFIPPPLRNRHPDIANPGGADLADNIRKMRVSISFSSKTLKFWIQTFQCVDCATFTVNEYFS